MEVITGNVHLKPINYEELLPFIYIGFKDDPDFAAKYATMPGSYEEMSLINYNVQKDWLSYNAEFYITELVQAGEFPIPIGFICLVRTEKNILTSFGIHPNFRKKKILLKWLQCIKDKMGGPFLVTLYHINTRAIYFFIRNGFEINNKTETITVLSWQ